MWKRKLFYFFNPKQRFIIRKLYYFPSLINDWFSKKSETPIPPKALIFTGRGDFIAMGKQYVEKFQRLANLKPSNNVLDVGCGIGRIAIPLSNYLSSSGSYKGFDVVDIGIKWLKKNIQSKHPNFRFDYIPLKNDLYNEKADQNANDFTFPYENNTFDFVCLISVFTHMQPEAVKNYLIQISRVMNNEAKCFATFFILDNENFDLQNKSDEPFFNHHFDNFSLHDLKVKDANIAFRFEFLKVLIENAGLEIESKHKGWWPGRDKNSCEDFQDILILKKKTY